MKPEDLKIYESIKVPCVFSTATPWFLDKNNVEKLFEEAIWIQNISGYRKDLKVNLKTMMNFLGLQSKGLQPGSFIKSDDVEKWNKDCDLLLWSEKYFWPPLKSHGASRHAYLQNTQLKGIGRNKLIGHDHSGYSSGALDKEDAFSSLVNEILLKKRGVKIISTYGVFRYEDYSEICFIVRELPSLRLAQLYPPFLNKVRKERLKAILVKAWGTKNILNEICSFYIDILQKGIALKNTSPENLLVDGAIVDFDAISFFKEKKPVFQLEIRVLKSELESVTDKTKPFDKIQDSFSKIIFCDSSIHRLRLLLRSYMFVLGDLESSHLEENVLIGASSLGWSTDLLKFISISESNHFPMLDYDEPLLSGKDCFKKLFIDEVAPVLDSNEVYLTLSSSTDKISINSKKTLSFFNETGSEVSIENFNQLSQMLDIYA